MAFGYAHSNVARVVLDFADGGQVSTATFLAWNGVRLWSASLPDNVHQQESSPPITATGYDAAGHVVGRVQLGHME